LNESGTSQNLFLNLPVNTFANQTWAIGSGYALTFGSGTIIATNNTVTVNGNVTCTNGFSISGGGTLTVSSGTFQLSQVSGSTSPLTVGNDVNGGTLTQNGGNVVLGRAGGSSGSYQPSLAIGNAGSAIGVYNLNGGAITDATPNTFTYIVPGNAASASGTLNINGGATMNCYSLRIGNNGGAGTVNVTNGNLTVTGGEFSVGR